MAAEVPLVCAVAPALLFPTLDRLAVLLLLVPVYLACYGRTGRPIPRTPINTGLAVMSVMMLVSLGITFDLSVSLPKVASLTLGLLAFWALVRWITSTTRLWRAAVAMAICGAGLSLAGLVSTNWQAKLPLIGPIAASLPVLVSAFPGAEGGANANALAGTVMMFLPLQLAVAGVATGAARRLLFTAAALTGVALLLTQSRGGWLAFFAAGAITMVNRKYRAVAVAVLGVLGLAIGVVAVMQWFPPSGGNLPVSLWDSAAVSRVEIWSRAGEGVRDFWLTGMGMGTFRHAVPILYPVFDVEPAMVAHAHNLWLQTALDLGVLGLVGYLWVWAAALRILGRTLKHDADSTRRAIAGGLLGALAAQAVFGTGDAIALGTKVGLFFWINMALVAALGSVPKLPVGSPE